MAYPKVSLIVPTRNRFSKLLKMLSSLPKVDWLDVTIVVDGDKETYESLLDFKTGWNILYCDGHNGSVFCRNRASSICEGHCLYATDDIVFVPKAIEAAWYELETRFPDFDGVIGLTQQPASFHPSGVALVGKTFLERYPSKRLFFPNYFHFSCQEVYRLADKLGKFYLLPEVRVIHEHHGVVRPDTTAMEARYYKKRDQEMSRERRRLNLTWGEELNGKDT